MNNYFTLVHDMFSRRTKNHAVFSVFRYTVLLLSVVVFVTSSILLLIVSISTKYWKYVRITKTNKTSEVILQMSNSGLFHTCYSLNRFGQYIKSLVLRNLIFKPPPPPPIAPPHPAHHRCSLLRVGVYLTEITFLFSLVKLIS